MVIYAGASWLVQSRGQVRTSDSVSQMAEQRGHRGGQAGLSLRPAKSTCPRGIPIDIRKSQPLLETAWTRVEVWRPGGRNMKIVGTTAWPEILWWLQMRTRMTTKDLAFGKLRLKWASPKTTRNGARGGVVMVLWQRQRGSG
jgi:hypothetical protein